MGLNASGADVVTTTYGYDAFGTRVLQTGTSTTTIYPFKWYSIASSTGSGAKYATTTEYAFNGDALVSTTDQQFASGVATGSPATHYIHPDHLGSTNVVTNASGTVVPTLDYYPYGALRISSSVGGADSARKYVNRFADQSSLDYLNARYYEAGRGQFISQDPVFWENPKDQNLRNPQSLNSYSYASDNPITGKDPDGRFTIVEAYAALVVILIAYAALLATPSLQHSSTYAPIYDNTHIVQPLPQSHPAITGTSFGGQQTFTSPLVNPGGSAGSKSGVSITPFDQAQWPGVNLSQDGSASSDKAAPNTANPSNKIQKQMQQRGWTQEQIQQAINSGQQVQATNKANDNPATRYINPNTGQSVVVDNKTGEIIHVGGPGFNYGPSSGDIVQ